MNKIEKIKSQKRSFKAWFKFLPDELREKATVNLKNDAYPVDINKVIPFSWALDSAFIWAGSPEGHKFWSEINDAWLAGDYLPQEVRFKVGDRVYSKFYGLGVVVKNEDRRPIGRIAVDFGESTETMTFDEEGHMLSRPDNHERYRVHRLTEMQVFAIERLIPAGSLDVIELGEFWATENSITPTSRNEVGYRLSAARCFKSLKALGIVKSELDGEDRPYYELVKPNK